MMIRWLILIAALALLTFLAVEARERRWLPDGDGAAETRSASEDLETTELSAIGGLASEPTNARQGVSDVASLSAKQPVPPHPARSFGAIAGRVVDDLGTPVPDFTIACVRPFRPPPGVTWSGEVLLRGPNAEALQAALAEEGAAPVSRKFVGPDGSFRIEGLAPGQWEVTARVSEELNSVPEIVELQSAETSLTLLVPRPCSVEGYVIDSRGDPVDGARVFLLYAGSGRLSYEDEPEPRALTGPSGAFRLEGVAPAAVELVARHDYGESERLACSLASGDTRTGMTLLLLPGGSVHGALDPSLREVASRQIHLFSFFGDVGTRTTQTDMNGSFAFEGVRPQEYVLRLVQETVSTEAPEESVSRRVRVEEGKTTEVVLGAPFRSIALQGSVSCGGRPAAGVRLFAVPLDGGELRDRVASIGPDGRYELVVGDPGRYRFGFTKGSSTVFAERTVPDEDTVELSFEIPSGSIAGRVLDASGKPLARVPVTLLRDDGTDAPFVERYGEVHTNANGAFSFQFLAPATYTLRAPDGYWRSVSGRVPHGRVVQAGLSVDTDTRIEELELRLPLEGIVSGQVVTDAARGVSQARIVVRDLAGVSQSANWETQSDATGNFGVFSLAPGTYTIDARTDEARGTSAPFAVEAGRTTSVRVLLR